MAAPKLSSLEVTQEGRAGTKHQIKDLVKARRTAVVGVRNIQLAVRLRVEIPKESDSGRPTPAFSPFLQVPQVVLIHGEH